MIHAAPGPSPPTAAPGLGPLAAAAARSLCKEQAVVANGQQNHRGARIHGFRMVFIGFEHGLLGAIKILIMGLSVF